MTVATHEHVSRNWRWSKERDMAMDPSQTFEWMRRRIYHELEPENARLRQRVVELTLELAKRHVRPIVEKELAGEDFSSVLDFRMEKGGK